MKQRTVLISGSGVAGPTLAYWLARYGFRPSGRLTPPPTTRLRSAPTRPSIGSG
jgi:hypothetical protein